MIGRLRNWTKRWCAMLLCFTMIFCGCQPALLTSYAAGHSVKISKVDIATGEELEGATLQIIDSEHNVVKEWSSTKKVHEIEGLKTGEEYTLRETVAPDGYTVAYDTTFTIDETGKITSTGTVTEDGVLLVEDSKTSVKISKVNIATGEELEGATLQVLDKDGKVVDEWISMAEPHEIEGLKTGKEYTLRETVAPGGYTLASDTTFTIDETGKITSTGSISEDGVLLVEDEKIQRPEKKYAEAPTDAAAVVTGGSVKVGDRIGYDITFCQYDENADVEVTDTMSIGLAYTGDAELYVKNGEGGWDLVTGQNMVPADTNAKADTDHTLTWNFTGLTKGDYKLTYLGLVNEYAASSAVTDVVNTGTVQVGEDDKIQLEELKNPLTLTIEVRKVWEDQDNSSGARPDSITAVLYADDAFAGEVVLSEENKWTADFPDLPKTKDGTDINYEVREREVPAGYRASVVMADDSTSAVITNTLRTGNLEITKAGYGSGVREGDTFTFTIILDSEAAGTYDAARSAKGMADTKETVTFDESGKAAVTLAVGETLTIIGLPDGTSYSITEDGGAYEGTVDFESEGTIRSGTTCAALFVNRKGTDNSVLVRKKWVDGDDKDGLRPKSIKVRLYRTVTLADGSEDTSLWDEQSLSEDNSWYYEWNDLETTVATSADAQKEAASAADADYSSVSNAAKKASASASNASRSDADLDELYDEDGKLIDGDIFNDMADGFGKMWGRVGKMIATVFGLVDEDEVTITWKVVEVIDDETAANYTTTVEAPESEDGQGIWVITNRYAASATTEISGKKILNGRDLNAGEFTFKLTGTPAAEKSSVTNDANGSFSFGKITFTEQGTYVYHVKEEAGTLSYVTYDDAEFKVTIEVTEDAEQGVLVAADPVIVKILDGNETVAEDIRFTNTYKKDRYDGGGGGGGGGSRRPGTPGTPGDPPGTPFDQGASGTMQSSGMSSARLPKTSEEGQKLPFALLGALMAAEGLFITSWKRKEEQ